MKQKTQSAVDNPSQKSQKLGKRELLSECSGKRFYRFDKPDLIVQEHVDADAVEGRKESRKSINPLRNRISSYLFTYLDGFHIPTHFVSRISDTEMLVKKLEMIPISVRIYNVACGALLKRFVIRDGTSLEFPIIEHYHKSTGKTPTWLNEYHIVALGIATPAEFKQINRITSKANAVLRSLCDRRKLMLAELQLEFGRYKEAIVIGDELSPVTIRFLDMEQENKSQKDRISPENPDQYEVYSALSDRLELKI